MAEMKTCPKCGAELPANSPEGICPTCLMQAGLASEQDAGSVPGMKPTTVSPGFVPPEPEDLAKHFPQLEILELLGKGGMGAVYKARQTGLDRLVAVKILPPEVGADPAFAERFTREARALAKLSHQNIVSVFDSGEADGQYYFIMEHVDGANLRHVIETGAIKPEEALAIVPQICEALQFAHDAGIVHRDIKPENILVDKQGRVKIADFGLAKLLGKAPAEVTLTGTRQAMGTLHYMAPEQMQGAGSVDHRADIYSLGVVFYEMLTGQLPIGKFEPPSRKVQVDVRLDDVVLRSLESEPSRRYQHASEVKSDVESISDSPVSDGAGLPTSGQFAGTDRLAAVPLLQQWPVRTILTSFCAFLATFLPWAVYRNDITAWNTHVTVVHGTVPNWTLAIAALVITTLLVLRGLKQYNGRFLIPLLAMYGIVHTIYAGTHIDDRFLAPGLGLFMSLFAFAILLLSQLGRYVLTAARCSGGFLVCSTASLISAMLIWAAAAESMRQLNGEFIFNGAIAPSMIMSLLMFLLILWSRTVRDRLKMFVVELKRKPVHLNVLRSTLLTWVVLCTPELLALFISLEALAGPPSRNIDYPQYGTICLIAASLSLPMALAAVVTVRLWNRSSDPGTGPR